MIFLENLSCKCSVTDKIFQFSHCNRPISILRYSYLPFRRHAFGWFIINVFNMSFVVSFSSKTWTSLSFSCLLASLMCLCFSKITNADSLSVMISSNFSIFLKLFVLLRLYFYIFIFHVKVFYSLGQQHKLPWLQLFFSLLLWTLYPFHLRHKIISLSVLSLNNPNIISQWK